MFCRDFCVSVFAGLLILSAGRAAAGDPLQPVKPWIVDYDVTECNAQRTYGTAPDSLTLALRASPYGNTYELLLVTKREGPRYAEEMEGSVDFGRGPIKAWLLHYGVKDPTTMLDIMKFRISAEEMSQAKLARSAKFHIRGRSDVSFGLAAIPDLLSHLEQCTTDLQHYWNMTPAEQKIFAAPAVGDLREIFSSEDYPAEAMSRAQEGEAQFLLFIDEKGKVAACHVLKPSGIPVFDGMGCQAIRQRAKFKPAVDSNGKPVRSAVVTPPVVWRLFP